MRAAMKAAGLPGTLDIPTPSGATRRATSASSRCTSSRAGAQRTRPAAGRGHLHQRQRVRYQCEVLGMASHAGTTPMDRRRDAAVAAVAELALFVEKRAAAVPDVVGTIGMLNVPSRLDQRRAPAAAASAWTCAPPTRRATRSPPTCSPRLNHLPAPRPAPARSRDHARRRRPSAPGLAAALGARRRRRWACRCTACPAAPATTR